MPESIKKNTPNTITCLNLLAGCVSIFMAFNQTRVFGPFDGASARVLHSYSAVGKDLDSLSDLVSFGVAPAMLILNVMLIEGSYEWAAFAALLIPVFGAIRLAKFNNDTEQKTYFKGLPIPANAIFWIGVYGWIQSYTYPGWIMMWLLIALMCAAMVGNFKMFSLKFSNFSLNENFCRYVILVAAVIFVAIYGLAGLSWTILLYFLLSLLRRNRI